MACSSVTTFTFRTILWKEAKVQRSAQVWSSISLIFHPAEVYIAQIPIHSLAFGLRKISTLVSFPMGSWYGHDISKCSASYCDCILRIFCDIAKIKILYILQIVRSWKRTFSVNFVSFFRTADGAFRSMVINSGVEPGPVPLSAHKIPLAESRRGKLVTLPVFTSAALKTKRPSLDYCEARNETMPKLRFVKSKNDNIVSSLNAILPPWKPNNSRQTKSY